MIQIDSSKLKSEIQNRYPIFSTSEWIPIINGDECLVWRVDDKVVRVSPSWRTVEELQWVHDLTLHCSQTIPEVVQPLKAMDESTLFVLDGYPVTVFPFVEGDSLDVDNDNLRNESARILAKIHHATVNWTDQRPRPASKSSRPQSLPREHYPDVLRDEAFDAWEASLANLGLTIAPIHGDYYSRNVLATETMITGVIDWDEADITYLMAEVGWCIWEFCQNDAGDDLVLSRARDFVDAYLENNTVCPSSELDHAINFIRLRLRNEAVAYLARKARGEGWDKAYTEAEIRAFVTLRDVKL
ncbi:MAG: phosphotransferase [Chloroflexota bacterium]